MKKTLIIFLFCLLTVVLAAQVRAEGGRCGNVDVDCGNCHYSCETFDTPQDCGDGKLDTICWRCDPRSCSEQGLLDDCPSGKTCETVIEECRQCTNKSTCYRVTGDVPSNPPPGQAPPVPQRSKCRIDSRGRPDCKFENKNGELVCRNDDECPGPTAPRQTTPPNNPTTPPGNSTPTRPPGCGTPNQPTCPPAPPTCYPGSPGCPNTPTCSPGSPGCPSRPSTTPRPTSPPAPSNTPVPTNTPTPSRTPTPTPQQQSRVVSGIDENTSIISSRSSRPPASARLVCLQVDACTKIPCTTGPGKIADHRVRLSSKSNAAVLATETYIMECIAISSTSRYQNDNAKIAKICTTGDGNLDNTVFGKYDASRSNLKYLQDTYGYQFNGPMIRIEPFGVETPLTNPFIPEDVDKDNMGEIGIIEWQSHTDREMERTFYALNYPDDLFSRGDHRSQKQATWIPLANNNNCVIISWDPYGVVFNSKTGKPVKDAKVTLYKKRENGKFSVLDKGEVVGNFTNPFITNEKGEYWFHVPAGEYRMTVEAKGYTYPSSSKGVDKAYTNLYYGETIKQEANPELRNIPLDPESSPLNQFTDFIKDILRLQ